jgi:hypothetical protein
MRATLVLLFLIWDVWICDEFDPGMEFQFGQGDDAIHLVVCLSSFKIRVATGDQKKLNLFYGLNNAGVEELKALSAEIF